MLSREVIQGLLTHGTDEDAAEVREYLRNRYLHFEPRPDNPAASDFQHSFVFDRFDGVAVGLGGTASGKSEAGAYKTARLLYDTAPPDDLCKFFVVSETIDQAGGLWVEKLRHYIQPQHIQKIEWQSSGSELPRTVILKPHGKNKKRWQIVFRSYQQGRRTFAGFSKVYGWWCDEPIPIEILNELWSRCREYGVPGTKFLTLTPLDPFPELQEIYNNQAEHPDWRFYRFNAEENYRYGGIKDLSWLRNTPADLRETRRIGAFANISGAVFKEFDQAVHVIKPCELPAHCTYYRCIDFGFEHPTACLWAAKTPSGRYYIYHEWGAAGELIQAKVNAIKAAAAWKDDEKHITFADPEDLQQREEMAALGLGSTIAKKEPVPMSIEVVRRAMAVQEDGLPNLLIFNTCKELVRQIRKYRWQPPVKSLRNPRASPQKPVKEDDDWVNCLRMLVYSSSFATIRPWDAVKVPDAGLSRIWAA